MADITTIEGAGSDDLDIMDYGPLLLKEDIQELYVSGSVVKPKRIEIMGRYYGPKGWVITSLVDEYVYADFDGRISLDYWNIIKTLFNYSPYASEPRRGIVVTIDSDSDNPYYFEVSPGSRLVKERISDIDYLVISRDTELSFPTYCSADTVDRGYSETIVTGNQLLLVFEGVTEAGDKEFSRRRIQVSELTLSGRLFQYVFRQSATSDGMPEQEFRSTVYEIVDGYFQHFMFLDRFGGFTSFPMRGALELSPEYEFENARYEGSCAKVSGSGKAVFTQRTGGITKKAASVLSYLLLSDYIYHKVGDEWLRIVIETPDISFTDFDSLCYGSFSFRYVEDVFPGDLF